jgi:hypothetical protein
MSSGTVRCAVSRRPLWVGCRHSRAGAKRSDLTTTPLPPSQRVKTAILGTTDRTPRFLGASLFNRDAAAHFPQVPHQPRH